MNQRDKLIDLETRITYQEDTLHTLNAIVSDQQQIIDKLEQDITFLKQRIATLTESDILHESVETKPPHY
ncbi:MAG: SlyX family protein [Gammaproteobacteria bacterium]